MAAPCGVSLCLEHKYLTGETPKKEANMGDSK